MEQKKLWKKLILPLFIIFVMIMSGVGYMAGGGDEQTVKYAEYKFSKTSNGWSAYKDDMQIVVFNNPNELKNISIGKIDFNTLNSAEKIYVSANPEDNLGAYLQGFQFNILNRLIPKKISTCYEDNEQCKEFPLKTCADATDRIKVIQIKKMNETKIEYVNNCLKIEGNGDNLIKFIDKLTLDMLIGA